MYSHTENIVSVTNRDADGKPTAWAILGVRDWDMRGRVVSERHYKHPMPSTAGGTRLT